MAFKNTKNNGKNEHVNMDIKAVGGMITNVRVLSEKVVSFTIRCNGFSLYGMKLIENKDGGYFISPSQHAGKDGKWYNDYAVYLSSQDTENIIKAVLQEVNNEK